jgi:hypothetical protein
MKLSLVMLTCVLLADLHQFTELSLCRLVHCKLHNEHSKAFFKCVIQSFILMSDDGIVKWFALYV